MSDPMVDAADRHFDEMERAELDRVSGEISELAEKIYIAGMKGDTPTIFPEAAHMLAIKFIRKRDELRQHIDRNTDKDTPKWIRNLRNLGFEDYL